MSDPGNSPHALPERSKTLFGRDPLLERLRQLLKAHTQVSEVILIEGPGGTGKTVMLQALESDLRAAKPRVFLPIYDFYHIDNFRASAIEEAISVALRVEHPELTDAFATYDAARADLARSRITGDAFQAAQRAVRAAFVASYNHAVEQLALPYRIVLLFDTLEQAVVLSDGADQVLGVSENDASAGGEHWLRESLPQLKGTLTILGGRSHTLYGAPVGLYDALAAKLPVQHEAIRGLDFAATQALARDMLADAVAKDSPDRNLALQLDLDDQVKLLTWHLISEGMPFWVALLFTLEFIGQEPNSPLTEFQEQVAAAGPKSNGLTMAELAQRAHSIREHVFASLTNQITLASSPLIVAIQCMASIRKGLTADLLKAVLEALEVQADATQLFEQLSRLVIVKRRRSQIYTRRGTKPNNPRDREMQLFLHDEMYAWLDKHPPASDHLRGAVSEAVLAWYKKVIAETEEQRIEAVEILLTLPESDQRGRARQSALRDDAIRRRHQLERDLLGYAYEAQQGDRGRAAALFNLLMLQAIVAHESGHGTALHQEALRNILRQNTRPSLAAELEFAAHWLLRAAVQNEDWHECDRLTPLIEQHYHHALRQGSGLEVALLQLALAIAPLFRGIGTRPEDRSKILAILERGEAALDHTMADAGSAEEQRWAILLRARLLNFRGYLHRLNYELADAIDAYQRSAQLVRSDQTLAPQLRATTLRNLAFALSEDGDGIEAKRIGLAALKIHQLHGSTQEVALDRSTLTLVEIRLGGAERALRYAHASVYAIRQLRSSRALTLTLTALADAYRKTAEQIEDNIPEQDALFTESLAVLAQFEQILQESDGDRQNVERWCRLFQSRGGVYRSWGRARSRRHHKLLPQDEAQMHADFARARENLEAALRVAKAPLPDLHKLAQVELNPAARHPPLVLADLYEDLAAVYVNEDVYDERLYAYLRYAEAQAPEYQIIPGFGVPVLEKPIRAFWRELGQCELQRMIAAFGQFGQGSYRFNPLDASRTHVHAAGHEPFLHDAAYHLVRMMAYLIGYNSASRMVGLAQALTLREMLRGNGLTAAQLDLIDLTAYQVAEDYNLLYSESFRIVQTVIRRARQNLGYDL
ncbi:ATP-binding protein [Candidatus Viridilinea mediisalina]|uniref:Orc1-like AAA ATPase domain-containing protein n=1 Tax=Candidatus Viridilinea mediisalina TaxID=2024553 RepID=A0A2A6RGQ8_9CHLR|nr:ATP-binding protein [Candidatus Viridilinea mediisalina]PDW02314.1 hypothetical protein CJ255_14605 [Candidatus Viridilinea mediisalina]